MQCLGEALSGPLISSLQAAGVISSSQPRGQARVDNYPPGTTHNPPLMQAGPVQYPLYVGGQYPGFGYPPLSVHHYPPTRGELSHPPHYHGGRSVPSGGLLDTDTQSPLRDKGYSYEPEDSLGLHPERDEDLDQPKGEEISDELSSFLKESVAKPATNVQKKKLVEKYPIPKVKELIPPKMDMPMRLLVPKEVTTHDQWLLKMQATSYASAGPLISLLESIAEEGELDTAQISEMLPYPSWETAMLASLRREGAKFFWESIPNLATWPTRTLNPQRFSSEKEQLIASKRE